MNSAEVELNANLVENSVVANDDFAFIGAVHKLVHTNNAGTKSDLVLAAASQALRASDKTIPEVTTIVDQIWPGARTDASTVETALSLGKELGLLVSTEALDGTQLWGLTTRGVEDVDRQVTWVQQLKDRVVEDLVARASEGLGIVVEKPTAELWLERLVRALIDGIQASQDAYLGNVDLLGGRQLSPKGIDQAKVFDALEDAKVNPVTIEFLKTSAVAAFDPLDPFGNELITLITTGCVLHSYVAGRDSASTLARLGSPAGQRMLLDTPVLVDLVGPSRVQSKAEFTIRAAVESDWEVVVCEHSLEELINLLEREIPRVKQSFTDAHNRGVKAEWYASLVEEQLPTYCVEVLRDGTYSKLDEMTDAAKALGDRLASIGVTVREHENDHDLSRVERCKVALENALTPASGVTWRRGRSAAAIARDANSMALVWRARRRQRGTTWPGGWIISSDKHINPAYKAVNGQDHIPMTLSLAQWSTLISATIQPAEVVELASAAATQLVEEAMWLLPSRFPSDVAMSLAKQLGAEAGGSEMDLRYAQLTLDDSLSNPGEGRSAAALASDVLEARTKRAASIGELQVKDAESARLAAEKNASDARELAASEKAARSLAASRARKAEARVVTVEEELAWARKRTRRILICMPIGIVALFAAVGTLLFHAALWAQITSWVAFVLIALAGFRWCSNATAKLAPLLIAAAIEAITVVAAVLDLLSTSSSK